MKRALLAVGIAIWAHLSAGALADANLSTVALAEVDGQEPGDEGVRAFRDVAAVLMSPRCMNCHVAGDAPLQGDEGRVHAMRVKRGVDGRGTAAMQCRACHQTKNASALHGPPGVDGWRLPPPETRMAWQGLSLSVLCRDLKNPTKTGGRSPAQLLEHITKDHLVLWGWDPGAGRSRPPLSHDAFVAAFRTWVQSGAPCPTSSSQGS